MDYLINGFAKAVNLLVSFDRETYSAIAVTLKASGMSMIVSLMFGLPFGFLLGYSSFPGKKQIRAVVDTLMALPTVVIGLLVYVFISRKGPFGGFGLLFTVPGIAVAQVILVLPVIVALTATAIENLDIRLGDTLKTLGANGRQTVIASIIEGKYAVLAAAVTAYSRAISEVGISMMIGGNIKWHTRTITTAIALETGKGEFSVAMALGIVLLVIALTINFILAFFRKRT